MQLVTKLQKFHVGISKLLSMNCKFQNTYLEKIRPADSDENTVRTPLVRKMVPKIFRTK